MSWDSLIKVQGMQPKTISSTPTIDLDIRPTPKRKPKKTCLELFNKIVDYVLEEVNRIERGSALCGIRVEELIPCIVVVGLIYGLIIFRRKRLS